MDAGNRSDASHIATAAATFIKQNVSGLYKRVFGLMVKQCLDSALRVFTKSSFNICIKIHLIELVTLKWIY